MEAEAEVIFVLFKIKMAMIHNRMRLYKKQIIFSVRKGREPLVTYKIGI